MENFGFLENSLTDINLVMYGKDTYGMQYTRYRESRGSFGMVVVLSGEAEFEFLDGVKKVLRGGEIGIFSSRSAYIVRNLSSELFEHYTVNFGMTAAHKFAGNALFIRPSDIRPYAEKMDKLFSHWCSGEAFSRLKCMSILYECLYDVSHEGSIDNIGKDAYEHLMPSVSYINKNYGEQINITKLAKLCAMSETHFRRSFKKVCKKSPIEYLLDVRIERAQEFLLGTESTVSDIASVCGFSSESYFCRVFKERTGITPTDYRNMHTEIDI